MKQKPKNQKSKEYDYPRTTCEDCGSFKISVIYQDSAWGWNYYRVRCLHCLSEWVESFHDDDVE